MKNIKLTVKQKRFANEYIKSGNATQSYIDAGYSATSRSVAEANSRRLLGNERVHTYIELMNKKLEEESIADMKEIKQFWTKVIRSEEKYVEMKDRIRASELIARTNGAFLDKVEHSGETTQIIKEDVNLSNLSVKELKELEELITKTEAD